jgi:hypothetical protein
MTCGIVIMISVKLSLTDILSAAPSPVDQAQLHQIQQTIDGSCSSLYETGRRWLCLGAETSGTVVREAWDSYR